MSKKDYEAIAKIIRETTSLRNSEYFIKSSLVDILGLHFKFDNPRFDREKFKNACEVVNVE